VSKLFWVVFWVTALLLDHYLVQWALAVRVGKLGLAEGFSDAYRYFTPGGWVFLTAFRFIPYLILASIVRTSARKQRKATAGIAWGGFLGIVLMIVSSYWAALHPMYTGEHVSSTTAIAFVIIPFYAIITGAMGALAGVAVMRVMGMFAADGTSGEH
jgi:hypothetical protein